MDRVAIIRSMYHPMTNHNAAAFTALCGRNPLKGDLELLGNDRNDPSRSAVWSSTHRPVRKAWWQNQAEKLSLIAYGSR
jgi:hypothetical protein